MASLSINGRSEVPALTESGTESQSIWRRIASRLWGYDFFISYHWASGGAYAVALAQRLRDLNFDCFLDRAEYAMGDDWKSQGKKALRNTQRLVLIATPEAVWQSDPVAREVEIFTARSSRIIPIVFGDDFRSAQRGESPVLSAIPDSQLFIAEEPGNRTIGPSTGVLDQLLRTHRVLRRRTIRAVVVLVTMAVLATAAIVTSIFWGQAELERREAVRQGQLAQSSRMVAESDLLRETRGGELDRSLSLSVSAVALAREAEGAETEALRPLYKALEVAPKKIGSSWRPFPGRALLIPGRVLVRLSSVDGNLLAWMSERLTDTEPFAVVADLDIDSGDWRVLRSYNRADHGQPLQLSANGRWFVTQHQDELVLWDSAAGKRKATLPLSSAFSRGGSLNVPAISDNGSHVLIVKARETVLWDAEGHSSRAFRVGPDAPFCSHYALSSSGDWLACAGPNRFSLFATEEQREVLRYPVARGGGQVLSLGFVTTPDQRDGAVFASWSANQIQAQSPGLRQSGPHWAAGIWDLPSQRSPSSAPDSQTPVAAPPSIDESAPTELLIRGDEFEIVFAGQRSTVTAELALAVLDRRDPVQWLDVRSRRSFTVGSRAGAGKAAQFSPGAGQLLVVHDDGTARLWSLETRGELLRLTSSKGVASAIFLEGTKAPGARPPQPLTLVTLDNAGRIQAWNYRKAPPWRRWYGADAFALTPSGDALLLESGQLLRFTSAEPVGLARFESEVIELGRLRNSLLRLGASARYAALWTDEMKPPYGPNRSLRWVDSVTKESRDLTEIPGQRIRDLAISADGRHVLAVFEGTDRNTLEWLSWVPETGAVTRKILRQHEDGEPGVVGVMLDPLGRSTWQLGGDGELSRMRTGDTSPMEHLGKASRAPLRQPLGRYPAVMAADGSLVAFGLEGGVLIAHDDSNLIRELPLEKDERPIAVSSLGRLVVSGSRDGGGTGIRIIDTEDGEEIWSALGESVLQSIVVGRTSDLVAYQGQDGDLVVRSLAENKEVGRVPFERRAQRLDFVNDDRWLMAFSSEGRRSGLDVLVWRVDDLVGLARGLGTNGAIDGMSRQVDP